MTLSEDGQWMYDGSNWVPAIPGATNVGSAPPGNAPKMPMNKPSSRGERMSDIGWWASQGTTQFFILIGFIMMIMSAGYAHSATYTEGPTAPDQNDYDVDDNGLEAGEIENFTADYEVYEDIQTQHLKDRNQDTGNAVYWASVGPGFIVLGLLVFCLNDNSKEMSNSLRITMMIGTLYLLSNMLFDGSAINFIAGIGAN
ncbi:MAG: hypothetical protein CMA27_00120 [Euryarchaeota archaeon]|nr:hypothetical protein [Euryarchaeota archaeon]|tara:strand:+ start:768 stop:1364 length:597 start_codon:yes stop_codon:yes gene_type:complete